MITYSIIKKSQLEGAKRLDAEYYQPEYLEVKKIINNFGAEKLSSVTEFIRTGPFGSNLLCDTYIPNGVVVIRPFNLNNLTANSGDLVSILNNDCKRQHLYKYKNNDVFFARVGDVRFGIAEGFKDEITISPNIIVARTKKEFVSPYFLVAFLASKYGYLQVERGLKVVAQPTIETNDIRKLLIPKISLKEQEKIEVIIKNSFREKNNSENLYSQAESLLLEELGLKDFTTDEELWSVVNLSETKKVNRIDAEYFQPKYAELESRIKKYESRPLEKVLENVPAKFDSAKQPDKLFQYVELSNINTSIGIIDGFSEVLGKEAPSRAKRVLDAGDVIVSSVEGSLGKVALVHEEQKDFLASTGFFQFRSKEILPEVLLVLAKSIIFQWQLEKRCAGTILAAVPKESIKNMLIPILPKPIQQKIAELVRKSHEARKKAKELLESAKRQVEALIEHQSKQ